MWPGSFAECCVKLTLIDLNMIFFGFVAIAILTLLATVSACRSASARKAVEIAHEAVSLLEQSRSFITSCTELHLGGVQAKVLDEYDMLLVFDWKLQAPMLSTRFDLLRDALAMSDQADTDARLLCLMPHCDRQTTISLKPFLIFMSQYKVRAAQSQDQLGQMLTLGLQRWLQHATKFHQHLGVAHAPNDFRQSVPSFPLLASFLDHFYIQFVTHEKGKRGTIKFNYEQSVQPILRRIILLLVNHPLGVTFTALQRIFLEDSQILLQFPSSNHAYWATLSTMGFLNFLHAYRKAHGMFPSEDMCGNTNMRNVLSFTLMLRQHVCALVKSMPKQSFPCESALDDRGFGLRLLLVDHVALCLTISRHGEESPQMKAMVQEHLVPAFWEFYRVVYGPEAAQLLNMLIETLPGNSS
jgi:hypothetical protein